MKNLGYAALAAALLTLGCVETETVGATAPKAVFIVVDGIPADVIENTATPTLDAISAEGGYTRSWVGGEIGGASESPTSSAIGYNNLLTGTWANKHNVYDNSVSDPNYQYWDIFRIAKNHDPSLTTAVFSTWTDNRTKLIGDGLPEAGGNKIDYAFDGLELDEERYPHDEMYSHIRTIDDLVAENASETIVSLGPDLSWVYLEYTDTVGHGFGDSPEQTAAVEYMDGQLQKIWRAVERRREAHAEDWLIIVTTDHGRDAATGQGHGGQTERERTTWIVTNSGDLNAHFAENPPIVDILPSLAAHLELEIPARIEAQLDGQSFID